MQNVVPQKHVRDRLFLAGLVVLGGGLVAAILSTTLKRKQKDKTQAFEHKTTEEHDIVSGPISPPPNHEATMKNQVNSGQKWYKTPERWRLITEIVTLIFFMPYVYFTYNQLRVAQNQWNDSRASVKSERRAWVFPTEFTNEPADNKPGYIFFKVLFKNTGTTPAMRVFTVP
jgi:hypothetical protein